MFALECAMDELAVALELDPVELRLRNEPTEDESRKLPFSTRATRECYRVAAERFGWARRDRKPRSMRDGRWLIGWGVATATYPMNHAPASVRPRLLPDGNALTMPSVGSAVQAACRRVREEALARSRTDDCRKRCGK